jgi:predicted Ser/Thr protein kinase
MDEALQEGLRQFLNDEQRRQAALLSSGYQGSAYLYESGDIKLVVKQAAGGLLTGWFHRLMLRREAHIYQLLGDLPGVPHSPGMLDDTYLVLEFIDGESMQQARHGLTDPPAFYDRLREIISSFHALGIAHGDLKRKDNVLIIADELPVVIDFGTAVTREGNLFDRLLFRLIRRFDYNAWIKNKYDGDYAAITDADRRWYRPTIVENSFRQLRRFWRTITFRQARKRRQRARSDSSQDGS